MNKLQKKILDSQACQHNYIVLSEYISTGKNLLGVKVKAKMRKVQCSKCFEDNIQFIEKL